MKKIYNLIINSKPLEEAREFGRAARRIGDSIATNWFVNGSDEHHYFQMGYYEKDHVDFKKI